MSDKSTEFTNRLQKLLEEFGVEIHEYENYDGEENYVGSQFYLRGDSIFINIADLIP